MKSSAEELADIVDDERLVSAELAAIEEELLYGGKRPARRAFLVLRALRLKKRLVELVGARVALEERAAWEARLKRAER